MIGPAARVQREQARHAEDRGEPEHRATPNIYAAPRRPITTAARPLPTEAKRAFRPESFSEPARPTSRKADRGECWREQATGQTVQHLRQQTARLSRE